MRAVTFNEVRSSAVPSARSIWFGGRSQGVRAGRSGRTPAIALGSRAVIVAIKARRRWMRGAPEHGEHISYGRIETLSCRVFCERASINFGGGGRGRARPFVGVSLKCTSRGRRVALLRNGGEHIAPARGSLGLLVRRLVVTASRKRCSERFVAVARLSAEGGFAVVCASGERSLLCNLG